MQAVALMSMMEQSLAIKMKKEKRLMSELMS
jgi:hypothetical protein